MSNHIANCCYSSAVWTAQTTLHRYSISRFIKAQQKMLRPMVGWARIESAGRYGFTSAPHCGMDETMSRMIPLLRHLNCKVKWLDRTLNCRTQKLMGVKKLTAINLNADQDATDAMG